MYCNILWYTIPWACTFRLVSSDETAESTTDLGVGVGGVGTRDNSGLIYACRRNGSYERGNWSIGFLLLGLK